MRKPVWTDEKIKAGFDTFRKAHDRLPRAHEIDALPYLPSSRAIQKRFGGLAALRERLGYTDTHFGTGAHRSEIAHLVGPRGRQLEIELEAQLQTRFGERSVHTEKVFHGKQRVDFYVYTLSGNFGADIFFPATVRTMQNNINIKMKKYQYFTEPLYLVVANPDISQRELNTYARSRKEPFGEQTELVTLNKFMRLLRDYEPYED
jgi:hypothetical protein